MEEHDDDSDLPLILQIILFPIGLVLIILYIVFTLLTFGIFLPEEKKTPRKKTAKTQNPLEKLKKELEQKELQLISIRARIAELQSMTLIIKKNERRILFYVRLIIIILLVFSNLYFLSETQQNVWEVLQNILSSRSLLYNIKVSKSVVFADFVSAITDFNGFILIMYSLPAYLLYGTVGRFASAMKTKIVSILHRKHIPTFTELQLKREEERQIAQEITYLKMRIKEIE